ncbi:hypothetical protein DMX10_16180 [Pseudomonas sp. 57B-090624]|nr:hypothetical protein DMX10_16180 [Pseudomonas sp. 57B-090624]
MEQPPTPLQEAERSRCAGGRAAWMPREARQAMDGPSRRPPEQRWSEGTPAKPGPDDGASFLVPFQRLEKGLARGGETRIITRARQSAGLNSSSNT